MKRYVEGFPDELEAPFKPLPFAYISTGEETPPPGPPQMGLRRQARRPKTRTTNRREAARTNPCRARERHLERVARFAILEAHAAQGAKRGRVLVLPLAGVVLTFVLARVALVPALARVASAPFLGLSSFNVIAHEVALG